MQQMENHKVNRCKGKRQQVKQYQERYGNEGYRSGEGDKIKFETEAEIVVEPKKADGLEVDLEKLRRC